MGQNIDDDITQHIAQHEHLFNRAIHDKEHQWFPAQIGQIRAGEKVRVMNNAYQHESLAQTHNGRICVVLEVKNGDVICKSIDDRLPTLNGTHYPPYQLEQCNDKSEESEAS